MQNNGFMKSIKQVGMTTGIFFKRLGLNICEMQGVLFPFISYL